MARNMNEYASLYQDYIKLVDKANKRLSRLEKLAGEDGFEAILGYAYKNAQADIKAQGLTGQRFSKKAPPKLASLRARYNAVQRFLDMPTSTKTGIIDVYEKRAKKFSKDLNWRQLANVFESGMWNMLKEQFGSPRVQRIIARLQKNKDELLKQIEAGEAITFKGPYSRDLNRVFDVERTDYREMLYDFLLEL